ncbi:MAG: hypothetical protein ACUVQZ_07085 [Candidatus Caldatribacteriaceae bacterium]
MKIPPVGLFGFKDENRGYEPRFRVKESGKDALRVFPGARKLEYTVEQVDPGPVRGLIFTHLFLAKPEGTYPFF